VKHLKPRALRAVKAERSEEDGEETDEDDDWLKAALPELSDLEALLA